MVVQTEFSEPWDTSRWESLLRRSETPDAAARLSSCDEDAAPEPPEPAGGEFPELPEPPRHPGIPSAALMRQASRSFSRSKSFKERLDPLLCEYLVPVFERKGHFGIDG